MQKGNQTMMMIKRGGNVVSEFIKSRLDGAHGLIDEGNFEAAVEILKNLKLRVHEDGAEKKIAEFEETRDKQFEKLIKEIEENNPDTYERLAYIEAERKKYAGDYLNFYDDLVLHHDV